MKYLFIFLASLRIHSFSISAEKETVYARMNDEIAELGMLNGVRPSVQAKDLVSMNDDYIGIGYSKSMDEELRKISNCVIVLSTVS